MNKFSSLGKTGKNIKRIRFTFGYLGFSKYDQITYKLVNKFRFLPSIDIDLFRIGDMKHEIHIGIFKWFWRWAKIRGKWRFEDLSNK